MSDRITIHTTTRGIRTTVFWQQELFHLPDGGGLYRVVMRDDIQLMVYSSPLTSNGKRICQTLWLFDHPIEVNYKDLCDIEFIVDAWCPQYYTFRVRVSENVFWRDLGFVTVFSDGSVIFNGDHIGTERIRAMYVKALVLNGGK